MIKLDLSGNKLRQAMPNALLASSITKAASKQTYYTIRFLVDRERVADAYRAYAYFRWVDDILDAESGLEPERHAFIVRQKSLLECCYRGEPPHDAAFEEQMLVDLIQGDTEKNSGLQIYLRSMMAVMTFDAGRRGRLISVSELDDYTRQLAMAVTEAMHYFIGHGSYSPYNEARYMAVNAAHITHMLRDTFDDIRTGYFNIPREVLDANHVSPQDVYSRAYRAWVQDRVELARVHFMLGRGYLSRVENTRCRLAGFAYIARFEGVLDSIERDGYQLRPVYPQRKGLSTILQAGSATFPPLFTHRRARPVLQPVPVRRRPSGKS
jgi:phytoene/squalene synthetase